MWGSPIYVTILIRTPSSTRSTFAHSPHTACACACAPRSLALRSLFARFSLALRSLARSAFARLLGRAGCLALLLARWSLAPSPFATHVRAQSENTLNKLQFLTFTQGLPTGIPGIREEDQRSLEKDLIGQIQAKRASLGV